MQFSANQLYRQYKLDGGTLNFSGWLNREKTKGVIPKDKASEDEVYMALNGEQDKSSGKTILGMPTFTLIMVGVVIVGAIVVSHLMKKKPV